MRELKGFTGRNISDDNDETRVLTISSSKDLVDFSGRSVADATKRGVSDITKRDLSTCAGRDLSDILQEDWR